MNQPKASERKPPPRPRSRHAVPRSDADPVRETVTIPISQRLGYRIGEFATLLGVSYVTIWRHIRDKKIETVTIGGVRLVPRAYAIKCGLINENDNAASTPNTKRDSAGADRAAT